MKKILLVGPKSLSKEVVQTLQEVGTVHLTESEGKEKTLSDEKLSGEHSQNERILAKIDTLLSVLPRPTETKEPRVPQNEDIESWLAELSQTTHELNQKRQSLQDELSVLKAYEGAYKTLSPLLSPLQGSQNFEALGFVLPKREARRLEELEQELSKLFPGNILLFKRSIDEDSLGMVFAFPKRISNSIRSFLSRYGLNELKLPPSLSQVSLAQALQKMAQRLYEIPKALESIEIELQAIAANHRHALETVKAQTEDRAGAIKAIRNLKQTQKTFVLKGFNPQKDIDRLESVLRTRFGGKVHLQVEDCDSAPVLLSNHRLVRPFELFIKVLQPPKYGSIDPTPYFALFFPIFFGLIMGDIGYGLVFLALSLLMKLKTKQGLLRDVAQVILICSIYTILFGFVFGEFFGDWFEKLGLLHPMKMRIGGAVVEWNRMHSLVPLLITAIGIGVFHVTLGFVLKLIQSIKHKHRHETVEVIAILVALAGLFALIGVMAQQLPAVAKLPSVIALLIAVPLLIVMKGPMMLMELLSFVGNMLSYARLMAVGVASAYLAFVGNMLGGLVGNLVIGAIIAILFHIINMCLAFSPTIQSARLHYVEFFSKFYESGGHLYQPFARRRLKQN